MAMLRKVQMHMNAINRGLKKMKDKASYDSASGIVKKGLDQIVKLKKDNEILKYQVEECKKAIDNKDEKETKKWMRMVRNTLMFG